MPAKIKNKNQNLKQLGTKCYNVYDLVTAATRKEPAVMTKISTTKFVQMAQTRNRMAA